MPRDFTIVDAPQRSDAWKLARAGRLTGSVAKDILATVKSGKPSTSRYNLLMRLMLERLTGKPMESDYVSAAMLVGTEREASAVACYEAHTGDVVQFTGFLAHNSLMAGASLDGHLGDFDKLLSIKCRQPAAHYEFWKSGVVPAEAMPQIRHELWIAGAQAHDYAEWNPDFPPAMQFRMTTVRREAADVPGYEAEAVKFLAEVDREIAAARGFGVLETA